MKDEVIHQARSSFREARDRATESLGHSRQRAAERIGGVASAFRSTSGHLRDEHQTGIANLADSLADQAERLGTYLRDRDLRGLAADAEDLARRQPAIVFGAALALGMLGARFFKSSQRSGGERDDRNGVYPTGGGHAGA